jgi:hypothetical protein
MNLDAVNQFIGSEWEYQTNDCLAVFRKASAAVFGVTIPEIRTPPVSDEAVNALLFDQHVQRREWQRVEAPTPGCAALFRDRNGRAVHIGLYVEGGNVLHCPGTPSRPGRTAYDPIRLLRRIFGAVEYYQHVPDNSN